MSALPPLQSVPTRTARTVSTITAIMTQTLCSSLIVNKSNMAKCRLLRLQTVNVLDHFENFGMCEHFVIVDDRVQVAALDLVHLAPDGHICWSVRLYPQPSINSLVDARERKCAAVLIGKLSEIGRNSARSTPPRKRSVTLTTQTMALGAVHVIFMLANIRAMRFGAILLRMCRCSGTECNCAGCECSD